MKRFSIFFSPAPMPAQRSVQMSSRPWWIRTFFFEGNGSLSRLHECDLQRKAGWIGFALLLQSLNEFLPLNNSNALASLPQIVASCVMPLHCLLTLGSFLSLWQVCRPVTKGIHSKTRAISCRRACTLLIVLFLLAAIGSAMCISTIISCLLAPRFTNDGTSLDTNAAISLLQGHNPYTDSSILDVARRFSILPDWTTPLREGRFSHLQDYPSSTEISVAFVQALRSGKAPEFESKVSYPALSFLSLVPFAFLHHYNVLPLFLASYVLLIAIAWKRAWPALRPWLLVLALANIPMWDSTLGGNLDIFCFLFITLAWLQRDRSWQSAIFLGLAVASKQTAWLFVPFYVLLIWRSVSFKHACQRISIATLIFLLFNLPFILWNPHAWLTGVLAPIADPMFPFGVGIITFSNAHILPYLPGWFYWLLEGAAMLLTLAWYQRWCLRYPEVVMILAVFPLFFAWRSLPSYFACIAFPLFVLLAARRVPLSPVGSQRASSENSPCQTSISTPTPNSHALR